MNSLFHNVLVSAPNVGALFLFWNGTSYRLDSRPTTGLFVKGGKLYRGIQPATVKVYGTTAADFRGLGGDLVDIHDVAVIGEDIYTVGTDRNVILRLSDTGTVLERWMLPGENDSYHLNCIGEWGDRIVYSCFGEFFIHRGYKGKTHEQGLIRDLRSGETLITGLSQPHSPTASGEHLLVANSELHEIREYDKQGNLIRSKNLGAYTRGIAVRGDTIMVGLSCPRSQKEAGSTEYLSQLVMLDRFTWEELGREYLSSPEIYGVVAFNAEHHLDALLQLVADNEKAFFQHRDERMQLESRLAHYDRENEISGRAIRAEVQALTEQLSEANRKLWEISMSSSWRFTAPLRLIMAKFRALRSVFSC